MSRCSACRSENTAIDNKLRSLEFASLSTAIHSRPLRQLAEVCDEHAGLSERRSGARPCETSEARKNSALNDRGENEDTIGIYDQTGHFCGAHRRLDTERRSGRFEYGWMFDSHILWKEPFPLPR
jgi:hypothetical protein